MQKFTNLKSATLIAASCLALLVATSVSVPAWAKDAPVLKIENFIGTIDVRTGDYDKITVTEAGGASVDRHEANVTIDDGQTIKNTNCRSSNLSADISIGQWTWRKRKGGYKDLEQYPKIVITAPENTHLIIDEAIIFGDIDNIGSADIQVNSCGDLQFANIRDHIDLRIAGSGNVAMGDVGSGDIAIAGSGDFTALDMNSVKISIAGSGDVLVADISQEARATVAGSGDTEFASVGGDFNFRGVGSGDLDVGNIGGNADISTAGSSDVELGRIEGDLSYSSSGSGDFDADYVGGTKLSAKIGGSGTVDIDGGNVTELYIKAGGSGSVHYNGKSTNAELYAGGSGSVTVQEPSGRLRKEKHGSGSIRIR